jgi:hypothetical protein
MDMDDKFPLHTAAREGRGMLNELYKLHDWDHH